MNNYETKTDRCAAWLEKYLRKNGKAKPLDVVKAGKEAGFGRTTIFKAHLVLKDHIFNTDGYKSNLNWWEWVE